MFENNNEGYQPITAITTSPPNTGTLVQPPLSSTAEFVCKCVESVCKKKEKKSDLEKIVKALNKGTPSNVGDVSCHNHGNRICLIINQGYDSSIEIEFDEDGRIL